MPDQIEVDFFQELQIMKDSYTPQEVVDEIDVDRRRVQNRLLEVVKTNPDGEEYVVLYKQLLQLNELIFVTLNNPDHQNREYGERYMNLHSELLRNGGLTPAGIQDPEHKIVSLAQERHKRTTANL